MKPEDKEAYRKACWEWATNSGGKDLGEYMFEAALAHRDAQPAVAGNKDVLQAAAKLAHDLRDLIGESQGVAGLHQNGELAGWGSLTRGGRFESWLMSLDELDEALIGAAIAAAEASKGGL